MRLEAQVKLETTKKPVISGVWASNKVGFETFSVSLRLGKKSQKQGSKALS
ncbi:MAG: hypothetical protein ACI8RN_002692 [Glaciecola sp.]